MSAWDNQGLNQCFLNSECVWMANKHRLIWISLLTHSMHSVIPFSLKSTISPGWVAQLVGVSSGNQKVSGSVPGQGTYLGCRYHPPSKCVQSLVQACKEATNWCFSLALMFIYLLSSLSKAMKEKMSSSEDKKKFKYYYIRICIQNSCRTLLKTVDRVIHGVGVADTGQQFNKSFSSSSWALTTFLSLPRR